MSLICKSVHVWVKARKTSGLRLWAQAEGGHTGSPTLTTTSQGEPLTEPTPTADGALLRPLSLHWYNPLHVLWKYILN
jgi:hypothetical protein